MPSDLQLGNQRSSGLVDLLDRVLDKGLVIAGDVRVSLAEVELLTIRIRLIVCSLDKAEQIGLDWWKYDHHLTPGRSGGDGALSAENEDLKRRVRALERQLLSGRPPAGALPSPRNRAVGKSKSSKASTTRR
ncbi:MAG: gas vesicle protein [Deltaproteobacteria bacterium]